MPPLDSTGVAVVHYRGGRETPAQQQMPAKSGRKADGNGQETVSRHALL